MSFSVIFDGALAALLMATITYAVILNRKLTELRNSRTEMERLIGEFAEATQQAEQGVTALHERAEQASGTLDQRVAAAEARVEEARKLADDLAFMIDRGGRLADRLEHDVSNSIKKTETSVTSPAPPAAAAPPDSPEAQLLRTLDRVR
ncbi:DUF6468 domain-containing protein [Algihabitans sp.]|uniref:DUF6468 domain-containing protein n=1 Tax=Algihabitans sp. TaxID=2821514 RepID=UPI003BAC465F